MSNERKPVIGLFGFGVVGEGIYNVLKETPSLQSVVKKICIRHPDKKRSIDTKYFTTNYSELLHDGEINMIVELIDDADEAFKIVSTALRKSKTVVSANKKMIAEHLPELLKLQEEYHTAFLYEAAACGSIPVIRNLEEYYDNDLLHGICGIVNGSTNFILTQIHEKGIDFKTALQEAQQSGFAESNPELDISGRDAVNKLTILMLHAFGIISHPDKILYRGIQFLHEQDARLAKEKGYKIKLIARALKIGKDKMIAYVMPQFVTPTSQLSGISNEYNGMVIESKLADKQCLTGKGAGRYPTSSAVLSDIASSRYGYKYEYRKLHLSAKSQLTYDVYLRLYVGFDDWSQVNKWDFEWVEEFHSTEQRHYLIGIIHAEKLKEADWLQNPDVSVIAMPDAIIQKESIIKRNLKKVSLQLAGV